MAAGPLVAAQAQTTTTTTGTGTLTIANTVPAGAPALTTTFAAALAPTGVYPVANIFYTIIDASGNIEAGYGTLTSATTLTRDFVIFAGTANTVAPYVPALLSTPTGSFINLAAGTANVYSNPSLLSQVTPYQQRFPNFTGNASSSAQDGGITEDIMSGSFAGSLTDGVGTTAVTVKYKVSSNGVLQFQLPAATVNSTGTALSITGVPSYLSNVTTEAVPCFVVGTAAGGVTVPGIATLTPGATPTSTGSIVFQQYTAASFPAVFTATFTASVSRGVIAQGLTFPTI
jgi:hypothetical protein